MSVLVSCRWIFQQLMVTLDYLHAKGVSHRDIKLENTLTAVRVDGPEAVRLPSLLTTRVLGGLSIAEAAA